LSFLVILSSSKSNFSFSFSFFLLMFAIWHKESLVLEEDWLEAEITSLGWWGVDWTLKEVEWCWSLPNPVPPSSRTGATEFS
jgi:hypothetical protein